MINCPKCASEALVESPCLGNIPLDHCVGCGGIWFDKGELEALLKQSQGGSAADLGLINPKADSLACPRCKNKMSRGGLVDPLLLVDNCPSCGGTWLDAGELDIAKKLLGLTGGPSGVSGLTRPPAAPVAPPELQSRIKGIPLVCVVLGFVGFSCEIYLYVTQAAHLPYMRSIHWSLIGTIISFLVLGCGIFAMDWGRKKLKNDGGGRI